MTEADAAPVASGSGRRTPRRRVARWLSWTAVITSASVLLLTLGLAGYFAWLEHRIDRVKLPQGPAPGQPSRPDPAPGRALNVLLLGSDTREGLSAEELARFATEDDGGGRRSDTLILLHLSADRSKSVLVSFPRDSIVDIPGHGTAKINSAFGKGRDRDAGALVARATIEDLTGIRIDHYVEVDFGGFLDVVDALHGVDVCLPKPAKDPKAGLDLPAGRHTLKGTQALAFVRTRSIDSRVDFGRIDRQQQFLASMLRKALSAGILLNPLRLDEVLREVTDAVRLDEGLGLGTMRDLAENLKGLDPARVTFITAPVESPDGVRNGRRGVILDDAAGAQLWQAIRTDGPIPGAADPDVPGPPLTVQPAAIRLRVLNGTGTRGLARTASDALRDKGFVVSSVGDADASSYDTTVVRYGVDREDSARTVSAAIPGSKIQVDATLGRTLEVVVGSSYSGVIPVAVSGTPPRTGIAPGTFETHNAAEDPCA